jgi:glycosyltransferase involved in cell wall biosynthesis
MLRTNPRLREVLGKNSRKFAEKYHDVKIIAKQYEDVLQECYEFNKNKGD